MLKAELGRRPKHEYFWRSSVYRNAELDGQRETQLLEVGNLMGEFGR